MFPIESVDVMSREVELRGPQQIGEVGSPLREPLDIARENGMRRAGIAVPVGGLGQGRAIRREFLDVGLEKQRSRSIQVVEIAIQKLPRQLGVERMMRELRMFQESGRHQRDIGFCRVGGTRRGRSPSTPPCRGEEQDQPDGGQRLKNPSCDSQRASCVLPHRKRPHRAGSRMGIEQGCGPNIPDEHRHRPAQAHFGRGTGSQANLLNDRYVGRKSRMSIAPQQAARSCIITVGGGKGGVGKSIVALNLATVLARDGYRVVIADMDLGAANQHLLLGLRNPAMGLQDLLDKSVKEAKNCLSETQVPNLRLLAGTSGMLGAANITHAQKVLLLRKLRALEADIIVVDVGAGVGYNALDFFDIGVRKLLVTTPQVTALHDAYAC